ncbi:kinesin motor domain protein, partial [Ostertagia ostertagi]
MKRDGSEIYTFDEVFDQLCTNVDIYDRVMRGIVDSALAGFNTAVCAYGQSGAEHRQLGETLLNERSSRSHTIIRLTIESHDVKLGGNATRCSVMNLVDLAGSENAAAAGTQGLRQKEGANINKSLLALSKVVSSLADNQKFIPYRDSKLTRILKPSLGGNSKTVIICCVAPFSVSETSSTLKFAKLAKKIITRPVVNEVNDDGLLSKYLREIELLKQELEKTKTKKENDEEERIREQRLKLAELMKGILNGRGTTGTASALSKKIRRQTWAPGNGPLLPIRAGSFSPPRKRERALGAIEECGGQTSDEKICSTGLDVEEKPDAGDGLDIPMFVQNERRSISKVDVDIQTFEPYPIDRSDEVATLKKGNASLAEQLSAKTRLCKELEDQKEELVNAFESLKSSLGPIQEVGSVAMILENKLKSMEQENTRLNEEMAKLRENNASLQTHITENQTNPSDRKRLLHRIEEQYEELCKLRSEVAQTKSDLSSAEDGMEQMQNFTNALRGQLEEVRQQYESAEKMWEEEKQTLLKRIEQQSALSMKDADSLALERVSEVESLKEALAASMEQVEAATRLAADTRGSVERELQQRYSEALKASEEELQQLRKDNANLSARIDFLLRSSGCVSEEEAVSLREEITELKDVIERKNKALEVARMQQDELETCSGTMERLSREKKDLAMRLKLKTENVEMLSSRVNSLRDEINEKQAEIAKAKNATKSAELNLGKVVEENNRLLDDIRTLRDEYTAFRANVDSLMAEKRPRIPIKFYYFRSGQLSDQLNLALSELTSMKKAKEQAEDRANTKERMLKKAMDTIAKLENDSQATEWPKEKARMANQIEDLQRQLRDVTEAFEQRRASISEGRYLEERKRMADEIVALREQLANANAPRVASSDKLPEIAKLKQDLQ